MADRFLRLYIHLAFAVKNRNAMIAPTIAPRVHSYMKSVLERHGQSPIVVGGMPDHVHILFSYSIKENLDEVVKSVKACTSRFINTNRLTGCRFEWQSGYAGFSVSQSMVEVVKNYILNQQEHHKKKTFLQEYEGFLSLHNFKLNKEYGFVEPL